MNSSVLLEHGFLHVGSWKTPDCRPHRSAKWLRYQPGLYAFMIDSTVMYVGQSVTLHRRLRGYGNRAFRNRDRPQRGAHIGIEAAIAENLEVSVFAKVMPGADEATLLQRETALLTALHPPWNGTYRDSN